MVGQVRRFSEALEKLPGAAPLAGGRERRQWREHSGESPIEPSVVKPAAAAKTTRRIPTILRVPGGAGTVKVPTILRTPKVERAADVVESKPAAVSEAPVATVCDEPVVEERRRRPRPLAQPTPIVRTPLVLEPAPRRGRLYALLGLSAAVAAIAWVALPTVDAQDANASANAAVGEAAVASPAQTTSAEVPDAQPAAAPIETTSPNDISESRLAAAADHHRIRRGPNLWVTRPQGDTSTWSIARERCAKYEVEGVGGWRLPFRRELQMLRVAGLIDDGAWWSRTLVADDKDAAYVLDAAKGDLVVWLRAEPNAGTLCVRSRP
jgi:hypothetical protein